MIFEIISDTEIGSEPTILQDAQLYFRSEDSNGIEDDLIKSFLRQARQAIETATNLSLIDRELEVYCDEYIGFLPYGPIDPNTLTIVSGTADTKGKAYPYVNESADATITYTTKAYVNEDILNAIYELASFWYFRGDVNTMNMPDKVKFVIKRHTRKTFV
jgi:hypothetical protein